VVAEGQSALAELAKCLTDWVGGLEWGALDLALMEEYWTCMILRIHKFAGNCWQAKIQTRENGMSSEHTVICDSFWRALSAKSAPFQVLDSEQFQVDNRSWIQL
jgi:hypothetical protein